MKIFDWKIKKTWPIFLGKENIKDCLVDQDLVIQFYNSYTHVKSYHSCRSIDIDSYFKDGITLGNHGDLLNKFIKNMYKYCAIQISDEYIESAKKEFSRFRNQRIFVVLDDRQLLEYAGHYAIYGSEYLIAVSNHIQHEFGIGGKDYLKKFGTPSVFEILLNIEDIVEQDLRALVTEINNAIYNDEISDFIDFTFELYKPVEPDAVMKVYHPPYIKDPLNGYIIYQF